MNTTYCCNKEFEDDNCPVYWNRFNEVIQCHHCGEQWLGFSYMEKTLNDLKKQVRELEEFKFMYESVSH